VSHTFYTTDAFVVGAIDTGENNRYVWFFTRELGVVGAVASGSRTLRSKTRYGLSLGAFVTASFVFGRDVWRLTSIIPISPSISDQNKGKVFLRLLNLVRRLSPNDGKQTALFDFFTRIFLLFGNENSSIYELSLIEKITALSVLSAFGYGTKDNLLFPFSNCPNIDADVLSLFKGFEKKAIHEINYALYHSHL